MRRETEWHGELQWIGVVGGGTLQWWGERAGNDVVSCNEEDRDGQGRLVAKARDGETGNVAMVRSDGAWVGQLQRGGAMGRVLAGCNGQV